jgi:alpha-L-fucosidase
MLGFLGGCGVAAAQAGQPEIYKDIPLTEGDIRQAGLDIATKRMPPGPVAMSWDSVRENFREPDWFRDSKFGIMMHWGLYSVPAHGSEWYERYMYGANPDFVRWHTEHFGHPRVFGYKNFIPMFTAERWDPPAWAGLFKAAGAKYVLCSAEHHDGFSLWDSAVNPYNAKAMGPRRDLIGDLSAAIRGAGLRYGVSNHSNIHFNFVPDMPDSDQRDPGWAAFYSVADRSSAARKRFLESWVVKNFELIDQYELDMLWLDMNGPDRSWDVQKLAVAAYYYNRANAWKKPVAISAKGEAFLAGFVRDYERQGRILPRGLKPFAWQVDEPIGNKFGFVSEMTYKPTALLIRRLVDVVSMNGNYLLNISPRADGTIPAEQQQRLAEMGRWLAINGEAIYGSRPWTRYGEGPYYDAPADTSPAPGPDDPPSESYTAGEIRFTTKGNYLYAMLMEWPGERAVIKSLALDSGNLPGRTISKVELLGHPRALDAVRDGEGLKIAMPADKPCDHVFTIKIAAV